MGLDIPDLKQWKRPKGQFVAQPNNEDAWVKFDKVFIPKDLDVSNLYEVEGLPLELEDHEKLDQGIPAITITSSWMPPQPSARPARLLPGWTIQESVFDVPPTSLAMLEEQKRATIARQNERLLTWLDEYPQLAFVFRDNDLESLLTHKHLFVRIVAKFLHEKV